MRSILHYIAKKIEERKAENNFRSLRNVTDLIDFTSNDYLGLSRDAHLRHLIDWEVSQNEYHPAGSTGSRLLSGNSEYAEALERQIAAFHKAETGLLFNSGFDANYGLFSSLPYKGDTVLYDELVHASIHDGIRAGKAQGIAYKHNDLDDLEAKLKQATGLKYVVTETVFSMDGDMPPLAAIAALCEQYDAGLIVDEAHATGIVGQQGEGLVNVLGLEDKCLARLHTFGKAVGMHGAIILGGQPLRDFLINYCRPFIFSTALPFHSLASIKCAYDYFPTLQHRRAHIIELIELLRQQLPAAYQDNLLHSDSPVQSLIVPGNAAVKELAGRLQAAGFDARPILYPTVARGAERIRICLHSFNTTEEIKALAAAIAAVPEEVII
jgi:8-amino-7-oxononanoate synthase